MKTELEKWRAETRGCTACIHLDNAGAGMMPDCVLDAMVSHLNREAAMGGYQSEEDAIGRICQAYESLAELVCTKPHNIAIVENATVAFFQALASIDFQPDDVIVTTRNDYISNQIAFLSLSRRRGVTVLRAADLESGGVDPQSVRELLRKRRVRLLAATWVPTNSGLVQPVEELGMIAEEAGVPYLIDACQAVGQFPIDVTRLKCDFLSATGRKFLRGPRGTGFLYVSDRILRQGDYPLLIDMRGAKWTSANKFEIAADAKRFENWEFAYSLVLGLGEAARYATHVGIDSSGKRARALAAQIRGGLAGLPGFQVLDRGKELAAIVTVAISGKDSTKIVTALRDRTINTSATFREYAVIDMDDKQSKSAIRISPHYYNTEDEARYVVEALQEFARIDQHSSKAHGCW